MKNDFFKFCFGFIILLIFYLISHLILTFLNINFPKTILGLILFIIALHSKLIKEEQVDFVCNILTKNIALFLVPYLVGLIVYKKLLIENWIVILLTVFITTTLIIIFTGLFVEFGLKLLNKKEAEND